MVRSWATPKLWTTHDCLADACAGIFARNLGLIDWRFNPQDFSRCSANGYRRTSAQIVTLSDDFIIVRPPLYRKIYRSLNFADLVWTNLLDIRNFASVGRTPYGIGIVFIGEPIRDQGSPCPYNSR